MRFALAPIKNSWTTSHLFTLNVLRSSKEEVVQTESGSLSRLSHEPLSARYCIRVDITDSCNGGLYFTPRINCPSRGHKYSISYTQTLYLLGISDSNAKGTIPSGPRLSEVCNHFPAPMNIPSLSSSLKRWFLEYEPNEATLVHVLCERLLPLSSSGLDEQDVSILYEFSGPFKTHDLYELAKGEEGIKYPMIKRFPLEEASEILQTPAESDLRSRSDLCLQRHSSGLEQRFGQV